MRNLVLNGLHRVHSLFTGKQFENSQAYWEKRYLSGETSGAGSYGRLALFKADALNEIVSGRRIQTVIELGCGDGAQLELARYPDYMGVDVSPTAVAVCRKKFAGDRSKRFITIDEFRASKQTADLVLSLDVIYHLVEDDILDRHLHEVFGAANRCVAIYSSNSDTIVDPAPHVRHREFTSWIERNQPGWRLAKLYKNPYPYRWWNRRNSSHCDLYLYERRAPV